jgi:hypothetical protein
MERHRCWSDNEKAEAVEHRWLLAQIASRSRPPKGLLSSEPRLAIFSEEVARATFTPAVVRDRHGAYLLRAQVDGNSEEEALVGYEALVFRRSRSVRKG